MPLTKRRESRIHKPDPDVSKRKSPNGGTKSLWPLIMQSPAENPLKKVPHNREWKTSQPTSILLKHLVIQYDYERVC